MRFAFVFQWFPTFSGGRRPAWMEPALAAACLEAVGSLFRSRGVPCSDFLCKGTPGSAAPRRGPAQAALRRPGAQNPLRQLQKGGGRGNRLARPTPFFVFLPVERVAWFSWIFIGFQ